jgi:hypothetical protein
MEALEQHRQLLAHQHTTLVVVVVVRHGLVQILGRLAVLVVLVAVVLVQLLTEQVILEHQPLELQTRVAAAAAHLHTAQAQQVVKLVVPA